MQKFFRKIRQGLLADNKFSKNMLYAIGEIVLSYRAPDCIEDQQLEHPKNSK